MFHLCDEMQIVSKTYQKHVLTLFFDTGNLAADVCDTMSKRVKAWACQQMCVRSRGAANRVKHMSTRIKQLCVLHLPTSSTLSNLHLPTHTRCQNITKRNKKHSKLSRRVLSPTAKDSALNYLKTGRAERNLKIITSSDAKIIEIIKLLHVKLL